MAAMTDTRRDWLQRAAASLAMAGIDSPDHDALQLLCHALGITVSDAKLHADTIIPEDSIAQLSGLLARRVGREPLAHITGTRGFWSLDLIVTPDVLDPRPDTETLIEATLNQVSDKTAPLRVLDLGTGSGAILLALLTELPNATGLGVDLSDKALTIAKQNAAQNNLADRAQFHQGDWETGNTNNFDIIVSNPPYIPAGDIAGLQPEVRDHEPHLALTPGDDGLAPYRIILDRLAKWAAPTALIGFECGIDQANDLAKLMTDANLTDISTYKDLGGIDRALTGWRK